jgi:uncharacterized protein with HEPN domain
LDYVEDIIEAMDQAELAIAGVNYDRFAHDFMINFVVVRALEIVGEATKRLPIPFRDQHPDIPWRKMAGMRDRIIHGYDTVDLEVVWNVVTQEIPQTKPLLQQLLDEVN